MSRMILTLLFVTLALGGDAASAQVQVSSRPGAQEGQGISRRKLSGPRFGFTVFTGDVADQRQQAGLEPIMTQFGWQWETQLRSMDTGSQALMEWVVLVGGMEQDEFNLSLGWLAGYRLESGLEFGVGPNLSYSRDSGETTSSMLFAAGATLPFGQMYIPINFVVSVAEGGPRITALIGWIVG